MVIISTYLTLSFKLFNTIEFHFCVRFRWSFVSGVYQLVLWCILWNLFAKRHWFTFLRSVSSFLVGLRFLGLECLIVYSRFVLSAKFLAVMHLFKSFICTRKSNDPSTNSWGTLSTICLISDLTSPVDTHLLSSIKIRIEPSVCYPSYTIVLKFLWSIL